jgi:hypothetical protein
VVKIELIPEGGAMINGLRTTLFVLTTERATGRPIPAKVQIEAVEGLLEEPSPPEVTTDSGGLAWFTVTPVQEVRWRLTTRSLPPEEHPDPSLTNALPVALPPSPVDAPLAANPTGERVVRLSSQARQIALVSYDPVWGGGGSSSRRRCCRCGARGRSTPTCTSPSAGRWRRASAWGRWAAA